MTQQIALVIEDLPDDMHLISAILRHAGFEVHQAFNGEEGMALLSSLVEVAGLPAVVITDLAMPVLDGWETLQAIRGNSVTSTLPTIAVTAYHSLEVGEAALSQGFNGYYAKPLHPARFTGYLREILG
jgi:CheY-like chemotaxis protein